MGSEDGTPRLALLSASEGAIVSWCCGKMLVFGVI